MRFADRCNATAECTSMGRQKEMEAWKGKWKMEVGIIKIIGVDYTM